MPLPATDPRSQNIALRTAVVDDALCLSVLAMQVFLDTYATEGIRPALAREVLTGYSEIAFRAEMVLPQSRWIVAERAGHLIGFAQITLEAVQELAPAGRQAELQRLYVQQPFVRMGIGTRLLEHSEHLAGDAGATVLWLSAWVHNLRALAFYAKRGYQDFGMTSFIFEGESHENRVYAKSLLALGYQGVEDAAAQRAAGC